jgi:hypothetical protein
MVPHAATIVLGGLLVVLSAAPAAAQRRSPALDPQPEEPRLERMMQMADDMRAELQRMHEEMGAMSGTASMQGMQRRLDRMAGTMDRMRGMMGRHREQVMRRCPALEAPAPTSDEKPGS